MAHPANKRNVVCVKTIIQDTSFCIKKMNIYKKLTRKAQRLIKKLQEDISSGRKIIYENYGQKEVEDFIYKEISSLKSGMLTYQEECGIKEILYKVSLIH
jgi:hypothetical protein